MKKLCLATALLSFCLNSPSWASVKQTSDSVTLDMKLEMNGKQVASPRMTMRFGQKAKISDQASGDPSSYSIEVEPAKKAENLVQLSVVVSQMENGVPKILYKTLMMTENGRAAEVSRKQTGLQDLRLVITPTL